MNNFRREPVIVELEDNSTHQTVGSPLSDAFPPMVSQVTESVNEPTRPNQQLASSESVAIAEFVRGPVKVRLGIKSKVALTTALLLTLASIGGSSVLQYIQPKEMTIDPTILSSLNARHPDLMLPYKKAQSSFQIWDRPGPKSDGLPYYDANFGKEIAHVLDDNSDDAKAVTRRDAANTTTTPASIEGSTVKTPASESIPATPIDFRNYGCNILAQHWVCSRSDAPFCVFVNSTVPAVKKILVKPMDSLPETSNRSERRLLNYKCEKKLNVMFVAESF